MASNGRFWILLLLSCAFHFTMCEWSMNYRHHESRSIVGYTGVCGIRSRSLVHRDRNVLLGMALPGILMVSAFRHDS